MNEYIKMNRDYLIIAITFILVFSFIFNVNLDLNGDNFNYLILAKALVQGKGYVSLISGAEVPVNFYPPGYPVILAFLNIILGDNIIAFKIINGLFFLISIILLFNICKNITNNKHFFFSVSILLLLNLHLMRFSTMIMSEMPFLFFSTLSIYFVYKFPADNKFYKSPYLYLLIISLSISYYIRSIGISIFIATVLHFLINRKWKISLSVVAGFILLYIPWAVRNLVHGLKSRYPDTVLALNPWQPEEGEISSVSEFLDKMIANFNETTIKGYVDALFPFLNVDYDAGSSFIFVLFSVIIITVVFTGAYNMGKLRYLFTFFLACNIFILMLWHGGNGIRYVVPSIPVISVSFYNGLLLIVKKITSKRKVFTVFAYSILIMGILSFPLIRKLEFYNSMDYPPPYMNYIKIARYLKENTPESSIVCGRKPEILYYFSERPSLNYEYTPNPDELIKDLIEKNVDFVILEQLGYESTNKYLLPAVQNNPNFFKTVIYIKYPDTYLLKFERDLAQKALME